MQGGLAEGGRVGRADFWSAFDVRKSKIFFAALGTKTRKMN
jgi:hypothetical protein